nr:uncharacterized protein LOC131772588 isoform X4 [Pocillopora verrucosa]
MTKKPEVVFFYGPPFSGKALFFKHHFSQTHKKINPAELFEATPSLSHREVILKVVNTLNEGHSVVVDDENSSKIKRKSYMAIIRKKVGLCNFRVIYFHIAPSSGLFICYWAREWELACQFELSLIKLSDMEVEQWFQNNTEPPSEEEGFNKIDKVDVQLVCDTPYKFVVPALFFQWEGLFQCQEEQTNIHKAVINVVKKWSHNNLWGRVVLLKLSEKQSCEGGKTCEWLKKMKQLTCELVTQVNMPIFLVHLCSYLWEFSRPPNPGLFAWLQRLHNIDLSNKATFFIHSSDDHSKAATAAGVKCIKANKLLQNPSMIDTVHCGVAARVPECVSKAKLTWLDSQGRPEARIPLFREAVSSHDRTGENKVSSNCVTVTNKSYTHGICFKDFASLERFNLQYKQAAIPTESVSGDLFNYEGCPVELSARRTEKQSSEDNTMCFSGTPGTPVAPLHKSPVRSKIDERKPPDTICPTFVVKSLTTEKIESHAFSLGHFRRGEGCTRLIRNVRSKTVEDGVLFSAKCIGSQDQLYDVSVVLNEKGVVRASCTCADPASKQGRCKHGVALLLRCKKEKNSASSGEDRVKKTKPEHSSSTKHCKRLKAKKKLETTMYFLSPEELLQTAQEILHK